MWKTILSVTVMAVLVLATAAPAVADSESSGDRMFEITKELYFKLGSLTDQASGDRVSPSVLADGTVILQGRLSSPETAAQVVKAAEEVAGVKRVVNDIRTPEPAAAD